VSKGVGPINGLKRWGGRGKEKRENTIQLREKKGPTALTPEAGIFPDKEKGVGRRGGEGGRDPAKPKCKTWERKFHPLAANGCGQI